MPGKKDKSENAVSAAPPDGVTLLRFAENSADILFRLEPGRIAWISPAVETILGWTPAELLADSEIFFSAIHPDDSFCRDALLRLEVPEWLSPVRVVARDGRTVKLEIRCTPFPGADASPAALEGIARDVTEQRKSEDMIRDSERRFRTVFAHIRMYSVILNRQGRIVFANDCFLRAMDWTLDAVLGQDYFSLFVPEESQQRVRDSVLASISQWSPEALGTHGVRTRIGELRTVRWHSAPLSESYAPAGIAAIGEDITAALCAEKDRAESEKNYRLAVEGNTDAILLVQNNTVVFANPASARLFGIGLAEMTNRPFVSLIHTEDRQAAVKHLKKRAGRIGKTAAWAFRIIRPDGSVRWVENRAGLIPSGGPSGPAILNSLTDITERLEHQAAVERSRACLIAILDAIPDFAWMKDREGRFVFVNRPFARAAGVAHPKELLGKTDVDFWPPEQADAFLAGDMEVMSSGIVKKTVEMMTPPDGSSRWVETFKAPVFGATPGEITGTAAIARDVTDRVNAEALKSRLKQVEKMEALGFMAAGIAHDFNNLLTGIRGYADLLRLSAGNNDAAFAGIDSGIDSAVALTRQLLGIVRQDDCEGFRLLNPAEPVRKALDLFQPTRKDLTCRLDIEPGLPDILMDGQEIFRAVLNLFVNAGQAILEGSDGGEIAVAVCLLEMDPVTAMACAVPPGPYVRISVKDTGIGIDGTMMGRLFEPFFTTKGGQGTGLGLATAYTIVRRHAGVIDATSEGMGKGAKFQIWLPVHRQ